MADVGQKVLTFNLDSIIKCEESLSPSPLLNNHPGKNFGDNVNNSATTDNVRMSEFGSIESSPNLDARAEHPEKPSVIILHS